MIVVHTEYSGLGIDRLPVFSIDDGFSARSPKERQTCCAVMPRRINQHRLRPGLVGRGRPIDGQSGTVLARVPFVRTTYRVFHLDMSISISAESNSIPQ
jgi:hypothetical protein